MANLWGPTEPAAFHAYAVRVYADGNRITIVDDMQPVSIRMAESSSVCFDT